MKPRTLGMRIPRPYVLMLALCAMGGALAEQVTVSVKEAGLRADKSFHASTLASLAYGTRLEVVGKNSGWLQVQHGGTTGWVHSSNVSPAQTSGGKAGGAQDQAFNRLAGQPVKPADGNTKGFSEDEVSLAGKGFNAAVEQQYQRSNPSAVNYRAVDDMEKLRVSRASVQQFAQAGGLSSSRDQRQGGKAMKQAQTSSQSSGSLLDKAGSLFNGGGPAKEEAGAKAKNNSHNPLDL